MKWKTSNNLENHIESHIKLYIFIPLTSWTTNATLFPAKSQKKNLAEMHSKNVQKQKRRMIRESYTFEPLNILTQIVYVLPRMVTEATEAGPPRL